MVEGYIKTGPRQHQNRFWPAKHSQLPRRPSHVVGGLRSSRRVEVACASARYLLSAARSLHSGFDQKQLGQRQFFADLAGREGRSMARRVGNLVVALAAAAAAKCEVLRSLEFQQHRGRDGTSFNTSIIIRRPRSSAPCPPPATPLQ